MKRLLILCADFGIPVWGTKGASVHLRSMTRALAATGLETRLAALAIGDRPAGEPQIPGRVLHLDPPLKPGQAGFRPAAFNAWLGEEIRRIRKDFPFDAIYERAALWSTAGLDAARSAGLVHFLEVNAPLVDESRRWRSLEFPAEAEAAEARQAREATRLLPVSRSLASHLVGLGADPRRITVLPNGVEPMFVEEGMRRPSDRRAGTFTIGFAGSLKPWHGVPALMDAFDVLAGEDSSYRLLILGHGPLAGEVSIRARGREDIRFAGSVPHAALAGHLGNMDVAAAPYAISAGDYFCPLKIAEYQAARVPVVASGGTGVRDAVEDGRTGLFVSDDAPSLAAAFREVRRFPERAAERAERAFARAAARTWTELARTVRNMGEASTAVATTGVAP